MRLLILDQFSDPGGAQQCLAELLPAFRARGWDGVVGLPGAGDLFTHATAAGFAAERIPCWPYGHGRKSLADAARFLFETPRLARRIAELARGVDLVYINGPRLLPAAALARLRAPVVFHAHSALPSGPTGRLAGMALRLLDARVMANCEFVARHWRGYAARLKVIYNGVRPSQAPPRRDGRTVACVGRIAPEKGQLQFLDVAGRIRPHLPDCRFVIHGAPLFSSDAYMEEVRARAARLPVEFAGWADDVYDALARTDVLLAPSSAVEATTRVILEAFAAGTPVVAYAQGGIPEVVDHGRTGFLAKSPAEMAAFAVELLRNPALRERVSNAARDCWRRRFSLERYSRDVITELETARLQAERPQPLRPAWGRIPGE